MREMTMVDRAVEFPACCQWCRTATGPFVDTGIIDPVGRVYLCSSCLVSATRAFAVDIRSPDLQKTAEKLSNTLVRVADLERDLEKQAGLAAQLQQQLDRAESELAPLRSENANLKVVLQEEGRELAEARRNGFVSAAERQRQAADEIAAAAATGSTTKRRPRAAA